MQNLYYNFVLVVLESQGLIPAISVCECLENKTESEGMRQKRVGNETYSPLLHTDLTMVPTVFCSGWSGVNNSPTCFSL